MIAVVLGLVVGGVALVLACAVVWLRWRVRDRRRRVERMRARLRRRDELERARRRLRLRVEKRPERGGAYPLPASSRGGGALPLSAPPPLARAGEVSA